MFPCTLKGSYSQDTFSASSYWTFTYQTGCTLSWDNINCVSLTVQKCVFLALIPPPLSSSFVFPRFMRWTTSGSTPGAETVVPKPVQVCKSTSYHTIWVRLWEISFRHDFSRTNMFTWTLKVWLFPTFKAESCLFSRIIAPEISYRKCVYVC